MVKRSSGKREPAETSVTGSSPVRPAKKEWTKARVLRIYADWQALERHAQEVTERFNRATGLDDRYYFDHLCLPDWTGSGWPGGKFEWIGYNGDGYSPDYPLNLPIEYLWSDKKIDELATKHEEYLKSQEGRERVARERQEYERLKKKFGNNVV